MRRYTLGVIVTLGVLASSCSYRYETRTFDLRVPDTAESSFIYDSSGAQIALLRTPENRVHKRIDEIPQVLRDAVIAIEDERFYAHSGFDLKGIVRSARSNVSAGGVNQGASTITQQYVGNVFLDRTDRTMKRKLEEIALARQFEQKYTKDFILEQYLNWIFLGNGANGVQAAAKGYFNKDVGEVTLPEAALLAGLIQRPSELNPFKNPEAAKRRRDLVLERMLANEFITPAEYREAFTTPLTLQEYVPLTEERYPAGHFVEEVKAWFVANPVFGQTERDRQRLLFEGGLKIYTTLDLDLQREAERARDEVMPVGVPDLEAAVVVMEPTTGNVLAMVGGKDFFGPSKAAKVNLATGDGRQAGSAMKPIGLAAALAAGWEVTKTYPAPTFMELPLPRLPVPWRVRGGSGGEAVSLIEATRRSYNTVYAQLILELGPDKFVDMAADLGIKSKIDPVHAAVLGSENVTVLDLATAYSTFASRGVRHDPVLVTRIVKSDGTTLYDHKYVQARALDTKVADQMSWILEGAITNGTGRSAAFGRPAAGKTGSAQNNADATFVGYTPQRATAVWVGFPEGQIPMVPPTTPIRVFGGSYPAQIFSRVMTAAHADIPTTAFPAPPPSSTTTTTTLLGPSTLVPDVNGLTSDAAGAALAAAGFGVIVLSVETDEYAAGTVVNQAPAAGSAAPAGVQVSIEVAATPVRPVPDVVGLPRVDARSQLVAAGFTVVEVVEPAPTSTTPAPKPGAVWRQAPAPGSTKPPDGVVQISVQPS